MNKSGAVTLLVLLIIVTVAFFYLLKVKETNDRETLQTSPAGTTLSNEAAYMDIDGNPIQLEDFLGSVIVATSWASWCPDCVEQLRILGNFSDDSEIRVLAFNRSESLETIKSFLDFYSLNTTVTQVIDPSDIFFKSIKGKAMPETVVFNREGAIIHQERDLLTETELMIILENIE